MTRLDVTPATSKWSRAAREARRLTAEERGFRDLRETPFADQVMDLARILGWRSLHLRPARTAHGWVTPVAGDGKGFPDLVLLRRGRLVVAELKRELEDPTPDQVAWLEAWTEFADSAGGPVIVNVNVWRPSDLAGEVMDSTIGRILR